MRTSAITIGLVLAWLTSFGGALAQQVDAGQANQGRDCQTIRTCNFARGAAVRGCLSSYTCRTCRTVPIACNIGTGQGVCQRLRCTWGG